jgi:hypothetical protein
MDLSQGTPPVYLYQQPVNTVQNPRSDQLDSSSDPPAQLSVRGFAWWFRSLIITTTRSSSPRLDFLKLGRVGIPGKPRTAGTAHLVFSLLLVCCRSFRTTVFLFLLVTVLGLTDGTCLIQNEHVARLSGSQCRSHWFSSLDIASAGSYVPSGLLQNLIDSPSEDLGKAKPVEGWLQFLLCELVTCCEGASIRSSRTVDAEMI